jgi:hypothetical protein
LFKRLFFLHCMFWDPRLLGHAGSMPHQDPYLDFWYIENVIQCFLLIWFHIKFHRHSEFSLV